MRYYLTTCPECCTQFKSDGFTAVCPSCQKKIDAELRTLFPDLYSKEDSNGEKNEKVQSKTRR